MLSRTLSGSRPYLWAIGMTFSGLKAPSVSITATLPNPPPWLTSSCVVTASVCDSWVLPDLYSPKHSVMDWVSIPPPRRSSTAFEPEVILKICFLFCRASVPVMNPHLTSFEAASTILSTLASDRPRTL